MNKNNEEGYEDEQKLAQQMKQSCKASARELLKETNPEKTACVVHEIGLIYRRRSPDKISLVKGAGLMNAAFVRKPTNASQIKSDLIELCQHILQLANAKNKNADLIKEAVRVKDSINAIRKETQSYLKSLDAQKIPLNVKPECLQKLKAKKISAMKQINKTIAIKYTQIMSDISQFCQDVLGKPPCEYAIVGMGSLAREEITPYSDFEHIILLSDDYSGESDVEYFRWFSIVFHVIILNVQESIIPSLDIVSLDWFYDDFTPKGISFDGMMPYACKFPLGRQNHTKNKPFKKELIKSVSEMLKDLSSEADVKNGYYLADILTKTCYVFGSKWVFDQFIAGVQNCKEDEYTQAKAFRTLGRLTRIDVVKKQVKNDLKNFSTRFSLINLKSRGTINIKQLVYRSTTIFISALANIHNISANSSFDVISAMAKKNILTENTAFQLSYAVAVACEMRLRVYTMKQSQCDDAIDLTQQSIKDFLDIIGEASTINYFQIAHCLQCMVTKQLNLTKLHLCSDPNIINFTICVAFGMSNPTVLELGNSTWNEDNFDFDSCINQLEKFSVAVDNVSAAGATDIKVIQKLADYLYSAKIYDEANNLYKQILQHQRNTSTKKRNDFEVANTLLKLGHCSFGLLNYKKANSYFEECLNLSDCDFHTTANNKLIAKACNGIGMCLDVTKKHNDSLKYFERSLSIYKSTTLNHNNDSDIAQTLKSLGYCKSNLNQHDDALLLFKQSLEVFQNIALDKDRDFEVARSYHDIGLCLMKLQKHNEALEYLNLSLRIKQRISNCAELDREVATVLNDIGYCWMDLNPYKEGLKYLAASAKIYQKTSLDHTHDHQLNLTRSNRAVCAHAAERYQPETQKKGDVWFFSSIRSRKNARVT